MPVEYKRKEEKEITLAAIQEVRARIDFLKGEADYIKNVQATKLVEIRREMAARIAWLKRYKRIEDEYISEAASAIFGSNSSRKAL